ncbi:hypothetical protein C815_00853 [Firmicutes bacterium M10-2]|nr:hypothetical protein C815_00853 [Firmicutes bacterium M10-2]
MTRRHNPALIELTLVILIFTLSSVVLLKLFASTYLLSKENVALANGQMMLESQMDQWLLDPDQIKEGSWSVNENMEQVQNGKYKIIIKKKEQDNLYCIQLKLVEDSHVLIDLKTSQLKEEAQ